MSDRIIGLQDWFDTPPGRYLIAWEREQFESALSNIFGYHALQLGLPTLDALQANRMPHRWLACQQAREARARPVVVLTDFAALPFPDASLDLVVLPHTLDMHVDPHATLREVARVLVPEGRVVICGFNPASLWGLRRRRDRLLRGLRWFAPFLPLQGQSIGYRRLRDWLHLLDFEIEDGHFGCYRPAVRSEKWLGRFEWLDRLGRRWWPIFGAAYMLVAVKRVHGMRLLGPAWKSAPQRNGAAVPLARRSSGDNRVSAASAEATHQTGTID
ncbi:MAG: class I SAM-dependent methyltransferase [Hylemonella sp.]|nr:class I SAM-dependent methyltransferase [Hylemonella sp.]